MKCGPDGCPILAFSDLTPAEQRVERGRTAKKMYEEGFTQEQIAKQLGVTTMTICRDLEGFNIMLKPPRPKGGRPKGKKSSGEKSKPADKPRTETEQEQIAANLLAMGKNTKEIASQLGVGARRANFVIDAVKIRQNAEAKIDPSTLSLSAQQKLATAIKQHQQQLNAEYYKRIEEEIRKRLEETVLPHYREKQAEAEKVIKARKGVMDKATFNRIRRCLHPDSRQSVSDKILAEAFDAFMALEKILLDEKDAPPDFEQLPATYEAWEQMKRDAMTARKARRAAGNQSAMRPR